MNHFKLMAIFFIMSPLLFSCQQEPHTQNFRLINKLALERRQETISIPASSISGLIDNYGAENLLIKEKGATEPLLRQLVDYDGDGKVEEILFQTDLASQEEKDFIIEGVKAGAAKQVQAKLTTYSRFVPERIDDYAWENDRVAFRTYGPEAQRITESGQPGGTLTSGIDAWLKRVDYPVIDKWYANHQQTPGAYHRDSGEGYDPYHVGSSRGVGGLGIWEQDSLWVSKNFMKHKTIATGPIRTIFELQYGPWQASNLQIQEVKRISLDLGSNLSRYEVSIDSEQPLPNVAMGLSLHEKLGSVSAKPEEGWFSYWEPMDGSELGVGLVIDTTLLQGYKEQLVEIKDQSHVLVLAKPQQQPLVYYAGFGWKKSGQFSSHEAWNQYLSDFSKRLASPVEVVFR